MLQIFKALSDLGKSHSSFTKLTKSNMKCIVEIICFAWKHNHKENIHQGFFGIQNQDSVKRFN
ncbi:hypothetical protein T10_4735 [Trichinella papuae]|uniref:Uncharacterized protein n=1 Tax=Trichinella papuae TaxID=268474 RepID=A0A0V1MMI3_9BILA|nr:hypothetical protein T10_4735 [Trichinella papuae]